MDTKDKNEILTKMIDGIISELQDCRRIVYYEGGELKKDWEDFIFTTYRALPNNN